MKNVLLTCAVVAGLMGSTAAFAASKSDANSPVYEAVRNGQWAQAESTLREALKVNANDQVAMLNLAYVLQNTGRAQEALGLYQQVLAQEGNPKVAVGESDQYRAKLLARKRIGQIYSASR